MSVAKDNKRLLITLDPKTMQMINNMIKSSNNSIRTPSEAIRFSVSVAYSALASYNEDTEKEGGKS